MRLQHTECDPFWEAYPLSFPRLPLNFAHMFLIDLSTTQLSCPASHSERKEGGEKKVSTETLNSWFSLLFSGARFKELNHTRMCSLGHAENQTHDLGLLKVSPFTFSSSPPLILIKTERKQYLSLYQNNATINLKCLFYCQHLSNMHVRILRNKRRAFNTEHKYTQPESHYTYFLIYNLKAFTHKCAKWHMQHRHI